MGVSAALVLLVAAATSAAPGSASSSQPGEAVRAVGAQYLKALTDESLFLQLRQGLPISRLPDVTPAGVESRASKARSLLDRLEAIPSAGIEEEDMLSSEMLKRKLRFEAEAPRAYWLGFDVTPYASPFGDIHAAFRALPLTAKADAERYLALLTKYPAFVDDVGTRLRGQAERGIRIPKDEVPAVRAFLSGATGASSPFVVDDPRLAVLPPAEAAAFRQSLGPLVGAAERALLALAAVLDDRYLAQAPDAVGLSQYPGGRVAYETLVKLHTTKDVTPDDVHRIGQEEVARIEGRMAEVRGKLGFTGSPADFREAVRKNPRFIAKSADEVGERLMSYIARIEPKVEAYFLRRPQALSGVKRLEAEREAGMTFGTYEPPTPTEPRGLYRFNGSQLEDRSLLTAGPLIYHELVPGHHFQIALQSENQSLPPFRREMWDTAYVEGWGDYSSAVAEEMGMYSDPYDLYGRLSMDMFISVRLVVDTGMNALGWSRGKAVQYMREHLMESDTQIGTESLRYSVDIPGQALAYKMGSRGLRELRARAETALGPRFDVRKFHDCILGSGSLPLSTLGRKVDAFIAKERTH